MGRIFECECDSSLPMEYVADRDSGNLNKAIPITYLHLSPLRALSFSFKIFIYHLYASENTNQTCSFWVLISIWIDSLLLKISLKVLTEQKEYVLGTVKAIFD